MDTRELTRPDSRPVLALGESRSRVLAALQDAATAQGVDEIASLVGLHPNTARFHLDALVEAGLVEQGIEDRERPGRPRTLYTARPDSARAGRRSYRLLAEILSSYLAAQIPQPAKAALEAGQAWGRYLAERPPPFQRLDADMATQQLVRTLDGLGFAPEAIRSGRKRQVHIHHCPFREAADEHPDVVCSIHLGLMQGLLTELDAPVDAERLDPFVEPSLCVTHLVPRSDATRAKPRPPRIGAVATIHR